MKFTWRHPGESRGPVLSVRGKVSEKGAVSIIVKHPLQQNGQSTPTPLAFCQFDQNKKARYEASFSLWSE